RRAGRRLPAERIDARFAPADRRAGTPDGDGAGDRAYATAPVRHAARHGPRVAVAAGAQFTARTGHARVAGFARRGGGAAARVPAARERRAGALLGRAQALGQPTAGLANRPPADRRGRRQPDTRAPGRATTSDRKPAAR